MPEKSEIVAHKSLGSIRADNASYICVGGHLGSELSVYIGMNDKFSNGGTSTCFYCSLGK